MGNAENQILINNRSFDFIVYPDSYFIDADQDTKDNNPPISTSLNISDKIFVSSIFNKYASKIFDTFSTKGAGVELDNGALGYLYSFCRDRSTEDPVGWDPNDTLRDCLALSRIIHPTPIGYRYSGLLRTNSVGEVTEIKPSATIFSNMSTSYVGDTSRNWLTYDECRQLSILFKVTCPP